MLTILLLEENLEGILVSPCARASSGLMLVYLSLEHLKVIRLLRLRISGWLRIRCRELVFS